MPLALGFALALSAALGGSPASVVAPVSSAIPQAVSIEEYVQEYFKDAPVMIEIARCESRFRQFDKDGTVLKNPTSTAMGIMQIMASLHEKPADKLGLDIYTIEGNLGYAKYLFDEQGTKPWLASSSCWGKENHIARK